MAPNSKSELEIVKRQEYLAEAFGEELAEGSITKGDQIQAKKNITAWLAGLEDQNRKKIISDGIAILEEAGDNIEEFIMARGKVAGSLTKLGQGRFFYNLYVAVTGATKAKRNSPEDARWGMFVKAYLQYWGLTRAVVYKQFAAYRATLELVTENAPTLTSEAIVKVADHIAALDVTPSPGKPAGNLTDAVTNAISAAAKKPGLDLTDAEGIKQLITSLDNLKPSSTTTARTKKELLMELHNYAVRGIYRVCKASEPGFTHGSVERVMNDFVGKLLKGLMYTETSVSFDVAAELDDDWITWDALVPRSKTIGAGAGTPPPPPPERTAHGFYFIESKEEKHKSYPFRVFQYVDGINDKFQKPCRNEKEAKKYIVECEALEEKANPTKPAKNDEATGASAAGA